MEGVADVAQEMVLVRVMDVVMDTTDTPRSVAAGTSHHWYHRCSARMLLAHELVSMQR